ncbi:hypothetical protein [Microbulbifer sp. TRSA005]|uniref:hypothetical protein n=1 Tax=unclassified Microbulbifer TaxID=2619833 RepID=UPI004039E698
MAKQTNAHRDDNVKRNLSRVPGRAYFAHNVARYMEWWLESHPRLVNKASWRNRCNALKRFGERFEAIHIHKAKLADLRNWWESLTIH